MTDGLRIAGALTNTPLASEHELRRRETRRAIPWTRFRRERHPAEALAIAFQEMRRLAASEYLAVDGFSRALSALTMAGAPLDLVAATARITTDEIRHADLILRLAALFGGCATADIVLEIPAAQLSERVRAYAGRLSSVDDLDFWMLEVPAFGETMACASLLEGRRVSTEPVARAVLESIIADEVRHARLGWYYLVWRSPQWSAAQRQALANRAGVMVRDAVARFGHGPEVPPRLRRAARALGILDTRMQTAVVARVMRDEIVPGFDALGFGASRAWKSRRAQRI